MVVHAYDIIFYLSSWSTLTFLWSEYRGPVGRARLRARGDAFRCAPCPPARRDAGRSRAIRWSAHRLRDCDRRRRQRQGRAAPHPALLGRPRHLVVLFVVGRDHRDALARPAHRGRGGADRIGAGVAGRADAHCGRQVRAGGEAAQHDPDPRGVGRAAGVFPRKSPTTRAVDRLFRSGDGELHKMRVETYGGASWLTEFSLLAGVSTYSFGGMRPFVQSLMAGKVRDTLPERLAALRLPQCRLLPFEPQFRLERQVLHRRRHARDLRHERSGREESATSAIASITAMRSPSSRSTSRRSRQPLFTFIITMATHAPYFTPYMPEVDVPGGGPGTNPEMHRISAPPVHGAHGL